MKPKAVLDTNVLIGPDRDRLVYLASKGLYRMVWSSFGIAEFAHIYTRKGRDLRLSDERIGETLNYWVGTFSRLAQYVEYTRLTRLVVSVPIPLRDPDDEPFLATAIVANAQYVVSDNTSDFPPTGLNPFPSPVHPFRRIQYIEGKDFVAELLRGHSHIAARTPARKRSAPSAAP